MLKKYKNHLIRVIQESGLNPALFTATGITIGKDKVFQITFDRTPLKFEFFEHPGRYDLFMCRMVIYAPGFPMYPAVMSYEDFSEDSVEFKNWINRDVKSFIEEKTMPDLWAQIQSLLRLSLQTANSEQDLLPFTEEEKTQVRIALFTFEQGVTKEFNPAPEQLAYIQQQLKYLSDSVERLNRFDWRGLALSILFGIAINLTVDTEGGRRLIQLWEQAMQAATHLLR